jgi:hypothetical protein
MVSELLDLTPLVNAQNRLAEGLARYLGKIRHPEQNDGPAFTKQATTPGAPYLASEMWGFAQAP